MIVVVVGILAACGSDNRETTPEADAGQWNDFEGGDAASDEPDAGTDAAEPPEAAPMRVSAGYYSDCWIREDHSVGCQERGGRLLEAPDGTFQQISVGSELACGLRMDDTLECWGGHAPSEAPAGRFQQVEVGAGDFCTLGMDGAVSCWGREDYLVEGPFERYAVEGSFERLTVSASHACGLRADGTAECWRHEPEDGQRERVVLDGAFSQISAGNWFTCGLTAEGSEVACLPISGADDWEREVWPDLDEERPEGSFVDVDAGRYHVCARRGSGAVVCWGNPRYRQERVPDEEWRQVSAGGHISCGVTTDGERECWGYHPLYDDGGEEPPPEEARCVNSGCL